MRRTLIGLAVPIAALSLALAGCTSAGTASPSGTAGGEKDTLTLAFETDPYGWDPASQPGYQNWQAEAVWDQLVYCGADGSLSPGAAETYEVSDENKTFTAHLREGMEFSDGTPVDSAAVQASFEYLKTSGLSTDYEGITFDAPDAQTISITWPESQPVMDNKVCSPRLAPAEWLAAGKFETPIGSGPYVLNEEESTTGSVYTFDKNEDYWDAANYPYQHLVVKVLTDPAAALAAMKTGQVDAGLVGQADLEQIKATAGFDVKSFQGQTTRLLLTDHLGEVLEPLGNVKVRQAINMVFDKEAMAENLYLGNAEPTAQVFRKGTAAYIDGLEDPYPYDIEKAKQLMAEAGYADGFELELPTIEGQNFETLMPYVTEQLAQINIKVTQVPLTGANAIGDLLSGTYPVVLWQLGNLGNSALQIYIESTPEGWWNLEHQPDEYVDTRWEQIATATPEESAQLQKEINQYQVDQAWFAPMVYMGTNFAFNADKVEIPTDSDQEALTPKLRDFR